MVQDIPHLYKIPFQENKNQQKHPQRPGCNAWLDAFPQPGRERKETERILGKLEVYRSVRNKASRLFLETGWIYVAGIKWDPVFWEGIKLDVKMLPVNFSDFP